MAKTLRWAVAVLWATAAVGGAAEYAATVSTTYEIDAASTEIAQAFGLPGVSRVDTTVTFSIEPLESGAYRLTFNTASQQTLTGESVVPNVERVGDILGGRWIEFSPWTLKDGGVKRAPNFAKDSEEISYNLLALMLFPAGGPLADEWRDGARAAVARSYGMKMVSMEMAEAQPLPAFEGEETDLLEYSVVCRQKLSQDTNVSQMTGTASFEGAGATVPAPDGLAAYGRLDISGKRDRSFVLAGKPRDLGDHVSISIRLVREGYELPADWVAQEEISAE
ncbi:MAG: hypothetical protein PVH29_07550 [Candidatus Zixiibacteriota bacterium]|jgi:hypothetical protein